MLINEEYYKKVDRMIDSFLSNEFKNFTHIEDIGDRYDSLYSTIYDRIVTTLGVDEEAEEYIDMVFGEYMCKKGLVNYETE